MYSWEIKELLELRNYVIEAYSVELQQLLDVQTNKQLNHIKFNKDTYEYEMWDETGEYFKFKVKTKEVNK